ncbi:MAG: winged helix-turn-helix domain-containing protein [Nitrospira sp.]
MLFIEALAGVTDKPTRRRRGSARCYGPPCEIKGCPGRTVGNKPYCLDHVHLMPYAAKIQEREADRDLEIRTRGGPPIDGFVAQDLLGAIRLQQSSIPALARDLRVPQSVVERLVQALVKAALVTTHRSKRSIYVRIVPGEDPLPDEEDQEP